MDKILKKKVAKYIYAYIGNTLYHNSNYYDRLVKEYGKQAMYDAIEEESKYGKISDAFN